MGRILHLNGTIASESWVDDDVTPQIFKNELMSGSGPLTLWINSPGGDVFAAAQIYNILMALQLRQPVSLLWREPQSI